MRKHLFISRKHSTATAPLCWWGAVVGKDFQDGVDAKEWDKARTWVVCEICTGFSCRTSSLECLLLTDSSAENTKFCKTQPTTPTQQRDTLFREKKSAPRRDLVKASHPHQHGRTRAPKHQIPALVLGLVDLPSSCQ